MIFDRNPIGDQLELVDFLPGQGPEGSDINGCLWLPVNMVNVVSQLSTNGQLLTHLEGRGIVGSEKGQP